MTEDFLIIATPEYFYVLQYVEVLANTQNFHPLALGVRSHLLIVHTVTTVILHIMHITKNPVNYRMLEQQRLFCHFKDKSKNVSLTT